MQILENHQQRLALGQTGDLSQQRLECFLLLALRRELESRVAVVQRHGQQFGQRLHVAFRRRVRCNEHLQFIEPRCGRVVSLETGYSFELPGEWEERAVLTMRWAEI